MRIARIAVLAGELATTIGIDGPLKRHPTRITLVEDRPYRQQKVLRPLLRFSCALGTRRTRGKAGDANQRCVGIPNLARTWRAAIRRAGRIRDWHTGTSRNR